MYILK